MAINPRLSTAVHLSESRPKVRRASLSGACTFRSLGQRCMDRPAAVVHILLFRPKVYGSQSAGRAPSAVSAKGVWIPGRGPCTFRDPGQRCMDRPAAVVHLLLFRAKVYGSPGCGRAPSAPGNEGVWLARLRPCTFWDPGQRCMDRPAAVVHLLLFRPKVYGFRSAGRAPSGVSGKGAQGLPIGDVHLSEPRSKVHYNTVYRTGYSPLKHARQKPSCVHRSVVASTVGP